MRQAERRAKTREALLLSAACCFAEHGYDGSSLDAISASAGLSKGAIYAHFETKLDLYLAVMTGVLDEAGARNQLVSVALTEGNAAAEAGLAYFSGPGLQQHVALVTGLWQMATREALVRIALDGFRSHRVAEFSGAAISVGGRPADALELALTVGKLIDADTLYGRLEIGNGLRAG